MAVVASDVGRLRGCCFGPPEAACLLTFNNSRWRLWGEQPGVTEVIHRDPAEVYSIACWGPGSQRLTLGCTSGRVQVWDPHAGELAGPVAQAFHETVGGSDGAVAALATSDSYRAAVYAGCRASPDILEIGIADGLTRRAIRAGKACVCQLACFRSASSDWLLSAGVASSLRLWHLVDRAADKKPQAFARLSGSGEVATSVDIGCVANQIVAACADNAMQVDVYCCPTEEKDVAKMGSPVHATYILSCHERIQSVRILQPPADSAEGAAVAKTRAGVLGFSLSVMALWFVNVERTRGGPKGPKSVPPAFTISAVELGGRVLCARGTAPQEPLVVAFGAFAQPALVKVTPPPTRDEKAGVEPLSDLAKARTADAEARASEGGADASGAKAPQERAPVVLGPLEVTVGRKQPKRKHEDDAKDEEDDGAAAAKRAAMLPHASRPESAGGLSMAPVVRQALRSKDGGRSVGHILQTTDRRVLDVTVAQLSGHEAFDMLQECSKQLLTNPHASSACCSWMQRLVLRHAGYISSRPLLKQALQPLHDIFEERCSTYRSLSLLRGRLQVARDGGKQVIAKRELERQVVRDPKLTYEEHDEDLAEALEEDTGDDGGEGVEGDSDDDEEFSDSDDDV